VNGRAYEHSGRLGLGPLLIPVGAIPATLLLALAYGYADAYCPIAGWVSLLMVGAYVVAVGTAVGTIGTFAKVRSDGFMAMAGAAVGLLALYTAWVAFEVAILGKDAASSDRTPSYLELLPHPGVVWEIATSIGEHGWYTIGGGTPSGLILWILWAIEAVAVVLGVTALAGGWHSDHVFCEACDQWCDPAGPLPTLGLPEGGLPALAPAVEGSPDGLAVIEGLAPIASDAPLLVRVDLKRCSGCKQTDAVRLRLVTNALDKQGKKTTETKDLSPWYLVETPVFVRLEAIGRPRAA
jgi:hypothetical protein